MDHTAAIEMLKAELEQKMATADRRVIAITNLETDLAEQRKKLEKDRSDIRMITATIDVLQNEK